MNKQMRALAFVGASIVAMADHALADKGSPAGSPPGFPVAAAAPPAVQLAVRNLREACKPWPTHFSAPNSNQRLVSNPPNDGGTICDAATPPWQFTWQIGVALAMLVPFVLVLFGFAMQAVLFVYKGIREGIGSFRKRTAS